ncbi:hypothetical protein [Saccharothrix australiensis]|uniref:Uncharacterized protein n=1 Tax=Saccharothrix australiensis TaxID=2072 RepID=A0A495VY93_9PSEU|nr:hypothetical protein [Saccharothrix australiensis]RKT54382.1 hypothetical protein C8E97_3002 [Saccharothrix australiensis]
MTGMRDRVRGWFAANAEHITVEFFPDPDGRPVVAGQGYLRLWLVEGFLAKRVSWGREHFPALHGGVTLSFLGSEATPFTRFTRPGASLTAPGAYLDYPMTALIPYAGGTVEVEAALYRASSGGPLETAVTIAGGLAPLIGPPLSTAATIAEKVSTGVDAVLAAHGDDPVLGVHWAMTSPGGGGNVLRPGHLAVVSGSPDALPGPLTIVDGRLHGPRGLLTGYDFLVLRVECREERDDWSFPELERLRREAVTAYLHGLPETHRDLRNRAVVAVFNSPDLTETDAHRVAKYVRQSIDRVTELGVTPAETDGLDPIPAHKLPDRHEVEGQTLTSLLQT